jgi:hypothetical protein
MRILIAVIVFTTAASVMWGEPDGGAGLFVAGVWALLYGSQR